MRSIDMPEKADILVTELLGSFGDNELSPECLDGAVRFLKRESQVSFTISCSYKLRRDLSGWDFNTIILHCTSGAIVFVQAIQRS